MDIPLEYLLDASRNTLGEYQLLHLKRAADIRKQILELTILYHDEMTAAGFALFMREHRDELLRICSSVLVVKESIDLSDSETRKLVANAGAKDRGSGDSNKNCELLVS